MVRKLTEDQESLAHYAWALARHRAALAKQLADVEEYERQAVALAARYGVRQTLLAAVTGRSPGRISQVVAATNTEPLGTLEEARGPWSTALEHPQDHLTARSRPATAAERDQWNATRELIHGPPDTPGQPLHHPTPAPRRRNQV
ncbi:hypothetical protein [Arthrobacter dokdonensis]|uniref:hypothetical protein n=1 Tax=Arthrobacter dokdonellae TaxID=2211210 RepID=UPI000DE58883|nr:hypothetical protein [Arthrobacter dokdonellae]